jgi:diguanylate cyclase (GGDEF)-like protein
MPDDEPARADALRRYEILNTPPEPNFDRITQIAASVLGRSVCTLALADRDRFWFKSKQGVEGSEMPRRMAFCEETMHGQDVFVVPDARKDPRFAEAPVVRGAPHFRFYAGAPLITPDGTPIGSLCVLDGQPGGEFDGESRSVLTNLASLAVELLEARARQIELLTCTKDIAHLARHDPLTGLPNRRRLAEILDECKARPGAYEVALLYLDLDGFKAVNDRYGHSCGDTLLAQVADRIRTCLPSSASAARLGGDEFAIILGRAGPDLKRRAAFVARRLLTAIKRPFVNGAVELRIGCSIGIAVGPIATSLEGLLARADEALYGAKTRGRGRYAFHETGGSACASANNAAA